MTHHPLYFWFAGRFYDWHTGMEVAATRTRTLVRVAWLNQNFWTWIDDLGERAWAIA